MTKLFKSAIAIVGTVAILSTAACSTTPGDGGTDAPAASGGTLKVLANGDVDHLDPQLTAYVPVAGVMHAISRSLIGYPTVEDPEARIVPEGDLAAGLPEASEDGLTYTFTLRDGVSWGAPDGARPLVANDFERGIKRLCNPLVSGAMLGYFQFLIEGMDSFCTGFADVAPEAAAMKDYIETSDISGIESPDDKTIVVTLTEPASDFIYMVSLDAAAPAPIEALDYLPDSPEYRANFVASGPYTVESHSPDALLVLKRNEAWNADSDSLRKAYVDRIEMTMGVEGDSAMQQLQAGSADMLFDIQPSPANIQQLKAVNDTKLSTMPNGGVDQFMWINTKTSNNNGALQDIRVRQALQYAVDKAAVIQTMGGEELAAVNNGIFGPGIVGYKPFEPYPTAGSKGDPEKAKALLAEAGYPDGITLKFPYRNLGLQPDIAQTVQSSLEKAGFTIELTPVPPTDYYANLMTNHDNAVNGVWDIALVGWSPDWQGGAARSVFQPQFTFNGTPQAYNYLDYNNDEANEYAKQALLASNPDDAAALWHKVDETVLADAVILPIASRLKANYHSDRVIGFTPYALSQNGDWANVQLKQ